LKKPNREKKPLKPIKILKKPTGSVWFYKPETEKIKPKPEKPEKKESNWKKTGSKQSQTKKTETDRFEPVSVFLKKI
jgi:hypothetical protein